MGHTNLFKAPTGFLACVTLMIQLVSLSLLLPGSDAKPLNNHIKFRRLPPKEFSAATGSSIVIECEAGGSPPPTIHWLKNGQKLIQNDYENSVDGNGKSDNALNMIIGLSATRSRLHIDCLNNQDEAVYTCVAENAYSRVSAHTNLMVIQPQPRVLSDNEQDDVPNSPLVELAALELSSDSTPTTPPASEIINSKDLAAVPQCTSKSTQGPVRIHMWTHNRLENMNNNVLLFCRSNRLRAPAKVVSSENQSGKIQQSNSAFNDQFNGQAPATITWLTPDDKVIKPDQAKYEILDTGDLLIHDLRWTDMGSYTCTVSDDHSTDSVTVFVYPTKSTCIKKLSMAARVDNQQASSSISSGIYKYCGDPRKLVFRLIIKEKNIQENGVRIDPSRSKVLYGEKASTRFSPLSASTHESFDQDTDQKSTYNASPDGPSGRVEYIINWHATHPTVEKVQPNVEKNNSNKQNDCCIIAKIVHDKNHLPRYKKFENYILHQQVRWNDTSIMMLSGSSEYQDVTSLKLYNHYQNLTLNNNDTNTYTGNLVNNNNDSIITKDYRKQTSTNNINKSITMCIILERIPNSTTFVDMTNSASPAPIGSFSDLIAQPSTSTQNFDNNTLSFIDTLSPHQHVLGLITLDYQSRLIIIKPDLGIHLDFNRSSNLHSLPKFTYWFRLNIMDEDDKTIDSSMNVISPIKAKINLTRGLFRPQLNQDHRPTTRSKKVFSSPINGSILTYIQLNILYAHSILPGKIENLYVRYRLFSQLSIDDKSLDTRVNAIKSTDKKLNYKFQNLYLDGTTVTSLPNSGGMFHFSCTEQLLIESKKNMQEQQLNLLMEFYSSDYYRKRLEGWAFVTLPRSNPRKIIEVDIIHYDLYRLVDRLRYHLLGTLPDDMIDIETVVLSQNRYLLPTRFIGKLVLDYEALQQVSDPSLDKAALELLKISDVGTRMVKIDIESVIQAYKMARKKLEALEC